ncbi:MAG: flagellar protein FlaG [Oscillospiraceae bacterium]|nr:flagellar protein FlaG [Oscillospiraceae bacterium]
MRIPAEYSDTQVRRALESDLDNMLKVMFPNRGVRFKIHESGNIIINIVDNETDEIIREIPSEKILDIIHSMTQRIGAITNKRM